MTVDRRRLLLCMRISSIFEQYSVHPRKDGSGDFWRGRRSNVDDFPRPCERGTRVSTLASTDGSGISPRRLCRELGVFAAAITT
jgi:hypothetical protein